MDTDPRIVALEEKVGALTVEVSELRELKTDVVAMKADIANVRVDIDRVSRKVLEGTLENRRADKEILLGIANMRSAIATLLEHALPKVIVTVDPTP